MSNNKASQDFNDKARVYLYSVSVKPKGSSSKADFTAAAQKIAAQICHAAKDKGLEKNVKVQLGKGALAKAGVVFMNAPEKFAALVKKMDGVEAVTKPNDKKKPKSKTKKPRD
jgi:hypothetical protein